MEDQTLTMIENRVCTRCLLRDMIDADTSMIEKYKAALKSQDMVTDDEYEKRLAICTTCDKLNEGTCMSCGCYVELRAAAKVSRCPRKMWQAPSAALYVAGLYSFEKCF